MRRMWRRWRGANRLAWTILSLPVPPRVRVLLWLVRLVEERARYRLALEVIAGGSLDRREVASKALAAPEPMPPLTVDELRRAVGADG